MGASLRVQIWVCIRLELCCSWIWFLASFGILFFFFCFCPLRTSLHSFPLPLYIRFITVYRYALLLVNSLHVSASLGNFLWFFEMFIKSLSFIHKILGFGHALLLRIHREFAHINQHSQSDMHNTPRDPFALRGNSP
ncbi:hypothetical protein CC80DRAFT_165029 [Byssothecium circinans]|uniref:Uncharacterized protein n=1 Tax=Byssothecium circinans TaxID=147558 RepID=A0A6A5TJY9_9PLEO|nr:hypothetical protein CC80DRAFT_165029 [Byssothecium circinans]